MKNAILFLLRAWPVALLFGYLMGSCGAARGYDPTIYCGIGFLAGLLILPAACLMGWLKSVWRGE